MPEELAAQMPVLKRVLDAMGVKRLEAAGWEADDILGTASRKCALRGWDCEIVTGDRDSFQLISEHTSVLHVKTKMGKNETVLYDLARFEDEYGFAPPLMVDLKALMGDASDNIPGVPGVGEKTAPGPGAPFRESGGHLRRAGRAGHQGLRAQEARGRARERPR